MVSDIFLNIFNFFWYGFLDLLWFSNIPGLSLSTLQGNLAWFSSNFLPVIRFINIFFPLNLLFGLVGAFIFAHIFLFMFRGSRFVLSIFKGGIK